MLKNQQETLLKRCLKRKVSFTTSVLVAFLITGGVSFSQAVIGGTGAQAVVKSPSDTTYPANYNTVGNENRKTAVGDNQNTIPVNQYSPGKNIGQATIALGDGSYSTDGGISIGAHSRSSTTSVAIGQNSASLQPGAISLGPNVLAKKANSIAIGRQAAATEENGVALGVTASARGASSISLGRNAATTGEGAIALGARITTGNTYDEANSTLASGKTSIALGTKAKSSQENAIALGTETAADKVGGVAIGSGSVTTVDKGVTGYKPSDNYVNLKDNVLKATHAGVSIGNGTTVTRQLTGLAAGTGDTDAVNVAQLKAIPVIKYVSINSTAAENSKNDGAKGTNSIAIGPNASAAGLGTVVLGNSVKALDDENVVIGSSSSAEKAANDKGFSSPNVRRAVVIGQGSKVEANAGIAIGTGAKVVASAGENGGSRDAIAIGTSSNALAIEAIAIGHSSAARSQNSLAIGYNAEFMRIIKILLQLDITLILNMEIQQILDIVFLVQREQEMFGSQTEEFSLLEMDRTILEES